jgi:hypothetical protein
MISHDAGVRAVHDRTYAAYRAALETILSQLQKTEAIPRFRLRPAAIALAALLDGLWIEASINPRTFKPAEAVALCEDWTNALCEGAFPSLRSVASRQSRASGRRQRKHGRQNARSPVVQSD